MGKEMWGKFQQFCLHTTLLIQCIALGILHGIKNVKFKLNNKVKLGMNFNIYFNILV